MAKIANVALTNTFNTWRVNSNIGFDRLSQFAVNNSALHANTVTANVSFTSIGLATLSGRATVGTNLTVSGNTSLGPLTATTGTFSSTLTSATGAAVGGATAGAGGVAFPATAVAVADANTLDDYEEGTWTPSLGGNATYNTQIGKYTKIGRLVSVKFSLNVNLLGTGSTSTISGLPFTVGSMSDLQPGSVAYFQNLAANVTHIGLYADDSSTTMAFATTGLNTNTTGAASAIFGNSARIQGQLTYNV